MTFNKTCSTERLLSRYSLNTYSFYHIYIYIYISHMHNTQIYLYICVYKMHWLDYPTELRALKKRNLNESWMGIFSFGWIYCKQEEFCKTKKNAIIWDNISHHGNMKEKKTFVFYLSIKLLLDNLYFSHSQIYLIHRSTWIRVNKESQKKRYVSRQTHKTITCWYKHTYIHTYIFIYTY